MKKTFVYLCVLFFMATTSVSAAPPQGKPAFPPIAEQLKAAKARPGSALEKLIKENQDFGRLKERDAKDKIVPPWLKVYWQKGHPEVNYDNENDPTGGYPHVLKEILEWMMSHQDLKPGNPDASMGPHSETEEEEERGRFGGVTSNAASAGTNVRTSGLQTAGRSESDIRVNYWNPSKIIAGSNNIGGSGMQGMYYSSDGGVTWGQTNLSLAGTDSFHSDPTVDWSSDGIAWSTTMGINGNVLKVQSYRSTDGGATWTFDGTVSGTQTNTDKQMQWIDHSASSPYANNNYVIWHNGAPAYMNRRTSSGWGTPIKVSGTETTGTAIGSDVKTNASGDVFGFYPDTGSRGIYVVKSTNGGASYSAPVKIVTTYDSYDIGVPSFANRRILIYVSGGAYRNGTTNNVYALWADLSGDTGCTTATNEPGTSASSTCKTRVWFSRSTDGGTTWSARVKINNQSGLNDQFNPFLAVDETNGNIGAIYYDTVSDSGRKKVDVWYQLSTDGGVSWEPAVKVTTAMTDETVAGADSGNQFGDYNGLSGYANQFFPSWTDRRNNAKEEIWTAKITTSSAPTFSVSGNAGTTGATLSAGTASATSDASSNYSIAGLAAGSYTVTPAKSGCTFSPASTAVTITSASVTGVNFTATCTTPTFSISGNAGTSGATIAVGASSTTSDTSSNYSLAGFAAGTYTVTPSKSGCTFSPASASVTITSANATANFTATCGSGDTQLTSGVALSGQSVAQGGWKYYYITVPAGATNLTFATTSATGDVDIYTQINAKPTASAYICRPYTASGNESCSATNPASGTWWLGVNGYAAGSYTVTATITMPVATYSISGNAGTTGATLTAGSQGATSDASSNYTISGLATGSYTVTPAKSGCTFSPASTSVSVTGANVTGINFTATCNTPSTLFTNGFETAGSGWATAQVSGTAGAWTFPTSGTLPTVTPHGGSYLAKFNSYNAAAGSQTRVYRTAGFLIPATATTATLKFWMYHDTGYTTSADRVQLQVSTGSTWTNVGTAVNRYDGSTGWKQHTIDLTAYKGSTIQLGFLGISAYGNNTFIDDVTVTTP
ncbi:MAG TPA: pre-peptidase C-terminal domain-containing protein [Thermoanaerobaculia bacterium]